MRQKTGASPPTGGAPEQAMVRRAPSRKQRIRRRATTAALMCLTLASILAGASAQTMSSNWYWPTGKSDFGGYLGWLGYNSGWGYHLAQDMKNDAGTAVYALGDGEVISSGLHSGYGPNGTSGGALIARFKAGDGSWFVALYGHLADWHGAGAVSAGEVLGHLNTYSPPHLHFGVRPGYDPEPTNPWRGYTTSTSNTYGFVDPIPYLNAHPRGESPAIELYNQPTQNIWYRNNEGIPWRVTKGSDPVEVREYINGTLVGGPYNSRGGYINLDRLGSTNSECWATVTNSYGFARSGSWFGGFDNAVPSASRSGGAVPGVWYNSAQQVQWSCTDGHSGVRRSRYRWVGATEWQAWRDGASGEGALVEGEFALEVEVEDNAWNSGTQDGNKAVVNLGTYKLDVARPAILLQPDEITGWYPTSQTVSWSVSGGHSGFGSAEIWWDAEVPHTTIAATGSVPMREGEHTFHIRAGDGAGNISQIDRPYRQDTVPPEVAAAEFSIPSPSNATAVTVATSASDGTGSGVKTLTVLVDGTLIGTGPSVVWNTLAASEAEHQVTVVATDNAGHETTSEPRMYALDRTPPVTTASPAPSGSWIAAVTVTLDASDPSTNGPPSGVREKRYAVDGGSEQIYSVPFSISTDGVHTVTFWSFDKSNPSPGNAEQPKSVAYRVDASPPTAPVVLDEGEATDNAGATGAQWRSTDAGSGIAGYRYTVTDVPAAADADLPWSATVPASVSDCYFQVHSLALQAGHTYYIRVQTVDAVGNWSASGQSDGIQVSGAALADRLRYGVFGSAGADEDSGPSYGTLGEPAVCTLDGNTSGRPSDMLTQPDGLGLLWAGFWQTDVPTRASSVSIAPAALVGGEPTTVTVSLTDPAPWPYAEVALSTDDPSALNLPATVRIPGGETSSAPFAVPTAACQAGRIVRIMATYADTAYADLLIRAYHTLLYVPDRSGIIGENVTLKAYLYRLPDKAWAKGGWVTFKVDGSPVGGALTDPDGQAVDSVKVPKPAGPHTLTAEFAGDTHYAPSSGSATLTALYVVTKLYTVDRTAAIESAAYLKAYLYRKDSSKVIPGKSIEFLVDGSPVGTAVTKSTGEALVLYTVPMGDGAGTRALAARFAGDDGYGAGSDTKTLTVQKASLYIWPYVRTGKAGTSHPLRAYVRSLPDYVIQPGKSITFKVNGSEIGSGTVAADGYGWASTNWAIPAAEPAGAHTATAAFAGDAWYKAVTANASFNVVK